MALIIEGPKNFKADFQVPLDPRFWKAVAEDIATEIMKRTEQQGLDVNDRQFAGYSAKYAKYKAKHHGHGRVNLSATNNMLLALSRGTRGGRGWAKVFLSGNEGNKAYSLENAKKKREFMGLSNRRLLKIFKKIDREIMRKNRL